MSTLYIRDVDETVAEQLKTKAAQEGVSLSSFVARELAKIAARPSNTEVARRLRNLDRTAGATQDEILDALHASRR